MKEPSKAPHETTVTASFELTDPMHEDYLQHTVLVLARRVTGWTCRIESLDHLHTNETLLSLVVSHTGLVVCRARGIAHDQAAILKQLIERLISMAKATTWESQTVTMPRCATMLGDTAYKSRCALPHGHKEPHKAIKGEGQ